MERFWLFDPVPGLSGERAKWKPPEDGRVLREIRTGSEAAGAVEDGTAWPVAYVERTLPPGGSGDYRRARGGGERAFDVWADPYRERRLAQVVTHPVRGRTATYEVFGAGDERLALITRRKPLNAGIRTRWSIERPGLGTAVGVKGRLVWWCVWWLFSPVWAFLAFGSPDVPRMPVRTHWRQDGRTVLDWRSDGLNVLADGWDPRVAAALVALRASHAGFVKNSWDDAAH